jgi:hypothetical protein
LRTATRTARATTGTTIKNRFAALEPTLTGGIRRRGRRTRGTRRSRIHRTWSGLRHDDTTRRNCGRCRLGSFCRWSRSLRLRRNRGWSCSGRNRGYRDGRLFRSRGSGRCRSCLPSGRRHHNRVLWCATQRRFRFLLPGRLRRRRRCNNGARRWPGRNGRLHLLRRSHNIGSLARLRHNPTRRGLLLAMAWLRRPNRGPARHGRGGLRWNSGGWPGRRLGYRSLGWRCRMRCRNRLLLLALLNRLQHVAGLGHARPVNLRLRLFLPGRGSMRSTSCATLNQGANPLRLIHLN